MKRTQIQLPDPLYAELKRVAEAQDWSVAEAIRRGAEYIVRCYVAEAASVNKWRPPKTRALGKFLAPAATWRDIANNPEADR